MTYNHETTVPAFWHRVELSKSDIYRNSSQSLEPSLLKPVSRNYNECTLVHGKLRAQSTVSPIKCGGAFASVAWAHSQAQSKAPVGDLHNKRNTASFFS